jgi:hypothetical protein
VAIVVLAPAGVVLMSVVGVNEYVLPAASVLEGVGEPAPATSGTTVQASGCWTVMVRVAVAVPDEFVAVTRTGNTPTLLAIPSMTPLF